MERWYPNLNGKTDPEVARAIRILLDNQYALRDKPVVVPPATPQQVQRITEQVTVNLSNAPIPDAVKGLAIVNTHAIRLTNYPPASQPVGRLFWEQDTGALYIISEASGINVWSLISALPAVVISPATGAVTLNLLLGNLFFLTLGGNATLSFSSLSRKPVWVNITQDGGHTVTWTGTRGTDTIDSNIAPLAAGEIYIQQFICDGTLLNGCGLTLIS